LVTHYEFATEKEWRVIRKTVLFLTLASLMVFGVVSCKPSEPTRNYKIGALVSQTGNYAGLGLQALDGMQLVADEINSGGGINGIPIELVVYDDKGEATEVALAAKKLVEVDRAIAVVEGTVTQLANSLILVANELEVPAVGISGTALFDDQLGAWFFRPMGSEVDYVFLILKYMSQNLGVSKYAALIENSGYGQGGKVFLPQLTADYGLTIGEEQYFDPGATDLTPQLSKIRNSGVGAIVIWGSSPTASMAISQIREMGISLPILTTPSQASPSMVQSFGKYYEMEPSVISTTSKIDVWQQLPEDDPDKAMLKEFAESWEAKYQGSPSTWNVLGSQTMLFLADGLKRSTPNPENVDQARNALRSALENTKGLDLLSGTYTMSPSDHYGCTRQKLILITYRNGQMVYLP
jgi:branched-chain amino acid transport system substrate-binding protein